MSFMSNLRRDFRARTLDPNRPLPIWDSQELIKQQDYQSQNSCRSLSHQQKTGVDKEDEEEFHLKEILREKQISLEENATLLANQLGIPVSNAGIHNSNILPGHHHSHLSSYGNPNGHYNPNDGFSGSIINGHLDRSSHSNREPKHNPNAVTHIPIPETKLVDTGKKYRKRKIFKISRHYYKYNQLNSIMHEPPPTYCADAKDIKFITDNLFKVPNSFLSDQEKIKNKENVKDQAESEGPKKCSMNIELFERVIDILDKLSSPFTSHVASNSAETPVQTLNFEQLNKNAKLELKDVLTPIENEPSLKKLRKLAKSEYHEVDQNGNYLPESKKSANSESAKNFILSKAGIQKIVDYYNQARSTTDSYGTFSLTPKLVHIDVVAEKSESEEGASCNISNLGRPGSTSSKMFSNSANDIKNSVLKSAYICFRRRHDKRVQTRKNKRNDEINFEKLVRLQLEMVQMGKNFEMLSYREKLKKEFLESCVNLLKQRIKHSDVTGQESLLFYLQDLEEHPEVKSEDSDLESEFLNETEDADFNDKASEILSMTSKNTSNFTTSDDEGKGIGSMSSTTKRQLIRTASKNENFDKILEKIESLNQEEISSFDRKKAELIRSIEEKNARNLKNALRLTDIDAESIIKKVTIGRRNKKKERQTKKNIKDKFKYKKDKERHLNISGHIDPEDSYANDFIPGYESSASDSEDSNFETISQKSGLSLKSSTHSNKNLGLNVAVNDVTKNSSGANLISPSNNNLNKNVDAQTLIQLLALISNQGNANKDVQNLVLELITQSIQNKNNSNSNSVLNELLSPGSQLQQQLKLMLNQNNSNPSNEMPSADLMANGNHIPSIAQTQAAAHQIKRLKEAKENRNKKRVLTYNRLDQLFQKMEKIDQPYFDQHIKLETSSKNISQMVSPQNQPKSSPKNISQPLQIKVESANKKVNDNWLDSSSMEEAENDQNKYDILKFLEHEKLRAKIEKPCQLYPKCQSSLSSDVYQKFYWSRYPIESSKILTTATAHNWFVTSTLQTFEKDSEVLEIKKEETSQSSISHNSQPNQPSNSSANRTISSESNASTNITDKQASSGGSNGMATNGASAAGASMTGPSQNISGGQSSSKKDRPKVKYCGYDNLILDASNSPVLKNLHKKSSRFCFRRKDNTRYAKTSSHFKENLFTESRMVSISASAPDLSKASQLYKSGVQKWYDQQRGSTSSLKTETKPKGDQLQNLQVRPLTRSYMRSMLKQDVIFPENLVNRKSVDFSQQILSKFESSVKINNSKIQKVKSESLGILGVMQPPITSQTQEQNVSTEGASRVSASTTPLPVASTIKSEIKQEVTAVKNQTQIDTDLEVLSAICPKQENLQKSSTT